MKDFDLARFHECLREAAECSEQDDDFFEGSFFEYFFHAPRMEFLRFAYYHLLHRKIDSGARVYLPLLDQPFGRFFVFGIIGSSPEAVPYHDSKMHSVSYKALSATYNLLLRGKAVFSRVTGLNRRYINSEEIDYLYKKFEDTFRGKKEDIEACLIRRYGEVIPYVEASDRALDLGCGRGEFLNTLLAHGYTATGVDTNSFFVKESYKNGHDVRLSDALKFLRKQDSNSYSLVSMFHLIEHLDLDYLLATIKEIHRVLKPGGRIIVETPNARNILVSAGDFYRDPTHKNPIFPDSFDFIIKNFGFEGDYYFFDAEEKLVLGLEKKFENFKDYETVSRDFCWLGVKKYDK